MEGGLRLQGKYKRGEAGTPLISIITVVKNNPELSRTIQCIKAQTYRNIEHIIIDGASTDETLAIIKQNEALIDYWRSEADEGIYNAMNKGIKLAKGNIVGILNGGDTYEPQSCAVIAKAYLPGLHVYHSLTRFWKGNQCIEVQGGTVNQLPQSMISHPGSFINREVYEQFGGYDESYQCVADYDYFIKLSREKLVSFHFLEEILANFFVGGISYSKQSALETYRIQYKYGFINWKGYWFKRAVLQWLVKS